GSRAHQVADHDGEMTALGGSHPRLRGLCISPNCCDERIGRAGGHPPNGPNEALPVAQRYPELLEIALCQLRQHIAVDRVLDECRLITLEAEVSQPAANVHGSALTRTRLIMVTKRVQYIRRPGFVDSGTLRSSP